jgi:hypothetical protein
LATDVIDEMERRPTRVDPELQGVDALCARWAREAWDWPRREANPIYRAMREREGASLPGGPEAMSYEVGLLCEILAHSEPRYYALVKVWYVAHGTSDMRAKTLRISRSQLYSLWRRTLEYLRGRLHAEGVKI